MFVFFYETNGIGGDGNPNLVCSVCGGWVTTSDRLLKIEGKKRHLFINPAGIECDLFTFSSCPGAAPVGAGTLEHTWFARYNWTMAFCRHCNQHLGWRYQSVSEKEFPAEFWGILVSHIVKSE